MRGLSKRERRLLLLCFLTIFVMANLFAGRKIYKALGGSTAQISELKDELAENRMWLEEKDDWDRRREWLDANMLPPVSSVGSAQGELIESLQTGVFERTLKIDRQSLLEPATAGFYDEVAVNLRVRGEEAKIIEWLSTLQSPEKFQVLKTLELEPDTKSKETEPQVICDMTVARWYAPQGQAPNESETPDESNTPDPTVAPGAPETPDSPEAPAESGEEAPESEKAEDGDANDNEEKKGTSKSGGVQLTAR